MKGEFSELRVSSPGYDTHVTVTPQGIWLTGKDGVVFATMHFGNGVPCLAVGDHRDSEQHGHQLALSVNKDGEPHLQIAKKGLPTIIVGYDKLAEAFGYGRAT